MSARGRQELKRPRNLDAALPVWLTERPLAISWYWLALFTALIALGEVLDWGIPVQLCLLALAVLPSLAAMIVVLQAAPRRNLDSHGTVFGHFFTRYLVVILGFLAWIMSVVLGAAISTTLNLIAQGSESELLENGLVLVLAALLPVATILWVAFLLRCAWFLTRVRGWRQFPATTSVPARLMLRSPRLRAVTIGLAHPGVLTAAAVISCLALLAIELTGIIIHID